MTQVAPNAASVAESAENWTVDDSSFGARLTLIRWRMGWNVKEAATACGVPAQSWRSWELYGRTPRNIVSVARRIADTTHCDYHWLLLGSGARAKDAA